MSKKIKKNNGVFYVAISLVAVFALVSGVVAYTGQNAGTVIENQTVQGDYVGSTNVEEPSFGAQPGTYVVVDELEYGSSRSGSLRFSLGATSTPGGLFTLNNSGSNKICTTVEIQVEGLLDAFDFKVATSTTATFVDGDGVIASSSIPTSTSAILDRSVSGNGTESFAWNRGEYLLGAFDATDADPTASSSEYLSASGKYYINCHEK